MKQEHINEIWGLIILALGLIIFLSLVSYTPFDLPFFTSQTNANVKNLIGLFGAYLAAGLFFIFGSVAFLIPVFFLMGGFARFRGEKMNFVAPLRIIGLLLFFIASSGFLSTIFSANEVSSFQRGGITGFFVSSSLVKYIDFSGAYIILITVMLSCFVITTQSLLFPVVADLALWIKDSVGSIISFLRPAAGTYSKSKSKKPISEVLNKAKQKMIQGKQPATTGEPKPIIKALVKEPPIIVDQAKKDQKERKIPIAVQRPAPKPETKKEERFTPALEQEQLDLANYKLPDLDLLESPPPLESRQIEEDLEANGRILEGTLADFGIDVRVAQIERGPVITRYELEPAPGVKIQRIVALGDDIALVMKASSVRVVAPIPGKARVGIEVPNTQSSFVYLKEVLETKDFQESESKLTLALGKDIAGNAVVADLGEMPHLLIAGTTGSGKTVCVNGLIMSMVYQATPAELKFIMVDPKMVELAPFNGLPHLLCPVLTDSRKVPSALNWVVEEMESRYRLLAHVGARNIDVYNEKIEQKGKVEFEDGSVTEKMPYIVIIIDELADLMAVARAEVENAITRLAQLSRAVGIHLILATQRPSVDVVTGVIKANFPARVSFKVASKVDSRTVLDMNGADKLLGRGDMLFLKPGLSKLVRAQSSLVKDSEIERVVDFIKSQAKPVYNEEILREQAKKSYLKGVQKDELFDDAVKLIIESNQASVSILQRRMRLGYTRAARLIDMMEEEGIVGNFQGSKPREILVDRESWLAKYRKDDPSFALEQESPPENE